MVVVIIYTTGFFCVSYLEFVLKTDCIVTIYSYGQPPREELRMPPTENLRRKRDGKVGEQHTGPTSNLSNVTVTNADGETRDEKQPDTQI